MSFKSKTSSDKLDDDYLDSLSLWINPHPTSYSYHWHPLSPLLNNIEPVKAYGYLTKEEVAELYCNNFHHRSCKAIEKRLKEHGINVTVHNAELFDVNYYEIISNEWIDRIKIAEALDIPRDWIGLVSADKWTWFIKQKEFNEKYCDEEGEIDFPDDWSIVGKSLKDIKERLILKGINCKMKLGNCGDFRYYTIESNRKIAYDEIAEALNISQNSVGIVGDYKFIVERRDE